MEQDILKTFLYNNKLRFSEIEKNISVRSNKLAYHVKNLVNKGILIKDGDSYKLSDVAESLIPYISEKKSMLPVILIHLGDAKNVFLYKREKRPFKDKLSLPGGRILLGETIEEATARIIREKYKVNCKLKKINSVSLEKVMKNKKIVHSFFLIFVTAVTKDKLNLVDIGKNKKNIISSDYKLLKEDLDKKVEIKEIRTLI